MERIRDISGWIYSGMWSYCPEYPGADIGELPHPAFLPPDYPVYLQKFVIGGQTGTYIETRAHVDPAAEPVTALPLSEFHRPVVVIDVGGKGPNEPVTLPDLVRASPCIEPGDAVLLYAGWDSRWEQPGYIERSPYIEREAALWLIGQDIGLLGSDFPRFDLPSAMQFPWPAFWEKVNLLLAPVTNLQGLSGRCGHLTAFPLKIRGACATPCRAAIFLNDPPESS
ncbi:MAG: cyclase family protein [Armatimonadetes bacterium]|nr:cyclase family protein [Armatimonadota bacterium]